MFSVRIFLFIAFGFISNVSFAQQYPCEKAGTQALSQFIGTWVIEAKDRTSPGNYENNQGESTITWGIKGCSLQEVYAGTFKEHAYAVKYETYLSDSLQVQRIFFDSEHANIMRFDGEVLENNLLNRWFRDPEKKRMQVKNEIKWISATSFQNITHLSTDYGQTWQLTHDWVYTLKGR